MTPSGHITGRLHGCLLALAICAILIVSVACQLLGGTGDAVTQVDTAPECEWDIESLPPPNWFLIPASLDEQVFESSVIARATLLSVTATTERVPSDGGEALCYSPVQELRFSVHEYLKGSGASELLVVVRGDRKFPIETEARAEADGSVAKRNTTWDDRQAALFLRHRYDPYPSGGASGSSSANALEFQTGYFQSARHGASKFEYAIDTPSRAWLPASDAAVGHSASVDSLSFITDGTVTATPVISLAELKSAIAEMAAMLEAGKGIEGHTVCIRSKFNHERYMRAQRLEGYPWTPASFSETLSSNSASGAEIDRDFMDTGEPKYHKFWVSGPDKAHFQAPIVDDDSDPANGYYFTLSTTRPLPAGAYVVNFNMQHADYIPCNFIPNGAYFQWTVTAEAPSGVLHEAFFDPVDLGGGAVGADGSKGVLKPAAFRYGNGTTTIERIEWASNAVEIELDPHTTLANHHADFIALNGTVSLRLDFDDASAVTEGGDTSLQWSGCAKPWKDGDLLMLRISVSTTTAGAVNPAPCELASVATSTASTP